MRKLAFYDIKYTKVDIDNLGVKMKEEKLKDLEKKLWEAADKMRGAVPV